MTGPAIPHRPPSAARSRASRRAPAPARALDIALRAGALALVLGLAIVSGESPRVLLYAYLLAVLGRLLTVGALANLAAGRPDLAPLLGAVSRSPGPGCKSKPYRDPRTREPVRLISYLVAVVSMGAMAVPIVLFSAGQGAFSPAVLLPEVGWGALLAAIYWTEDLVTRTVILDPAAAPELNYGYNLRSFHLLLAALFVTGFALPFVGMTISVLGSRPGHLADSGPWMVFVLLLTFRHAMDLASARSSASRPRLP